MTRIEVIFSAIGKSIGSWLRITAVMKKRTSSNKFGLVLAAALVVATSLACASLRELTGPSVPEGQRRLAERIPAGLEHAIEDPDAKKPSAFRVIMLEPGQIMLQDPDAQPIDIATLGSKVREAMSRRTSEQRVVYIAAAADIPTSELAAVIAELRRQKIETVKLLTRARAPEAGEGGLFSQPAVALDRVFELEIEPEREPMTSVQPNITFLTITIAADGRPVINNEPKANLRELTVLLDEIFKIRERNGVLRINTNEVEKTVRIKLTADEPEQNYGNFVKLINAVKGGGASPIVLTEGIKFPVFHEIDRNFEDPLPDGPSGKVPPDVISGGVLNGKAFSLPKPSYPPAARAVRATGAVNVQVLVDTDGNVVEAKAVSGHPLLRQTAVTAARSAKFAPTMLAGKPIKVKGILVFIFNAPE